MRVSLIVGELLSQDVAARPSIPIRPAGCHQPVGEAASATMPLRCVLAADLIVSKKPGRWH